MQIKVHIFPYSTSFCIELESDTCLKPLFPFCLFMSCISTDCKPTPFTERSTLAPEVEDSSKARK